MPPSQPDMAVDTSWPACFLKAGRDESASIGSFHHDVRNDRSAGCRNSGRGRAYLTSSDDDEALAAIFLPSASLRMAINRMASASNISSRGAERRHVRARNPYWVSEVEPPGESGVTGWVAGADLVDSYAVRLPAGLRRNMHGIAETVLGDSPI